MPETTPDANAWTIVCPEGAATLSELEDCSGRAIRRAQACRGGETVRWSGGGLTWIREAFVAEPSHRAWFPDCVVADLTMPRDRLLEL